MNRVALIYCTIAVHIFSLPEFNLVNEEIQKELGMRRSDLDIWLLARLIAIEPTAIR